MSQSEIAAPIPPTPISPAAAATQKSVGAQAWITLGALWFVYVLNFLDRQLLSILAKPIQDTLGVTDSQLGLLGGLYFAFFYCFIAVPVGWLADRVNRVKLVAVACAIWSAATAACGLSRNFVELAAARMTVGFGEAGGVPPSYAIVTDSFPPGRRGFALGLYNMGPPVGAALGIAFGASVAAAFSWRDAFVAIGVVGLATAIGLALFIKEPRRGGLDAADRYAAGPKASFWSTVKMFFSRPSLSLAAFGGGITQIVTYGVGNFSVLFLMREKGMTLQDVALWYALVVAVGMGGGIFASGWLLDRFTKRDKRAYALLPAISLTLALPLYVGFVWAPSWPLALVLLLGPTFLNYFYLSSSVALVQEEVRPDQRVLSGALLLLVMNFIGMGVGPTFVGAASDFFRAEHPTNSLQIALYLLIPVYLVAIGLFLWLARVLGREARLEVRP